MNFAKNLPTNCHFFYFLIYVAYILLVVRVAASARLEYMLLWCSFAAFSRMQPLSIKLAVSLPWLPFFSLLVSSPHSSQVLNYNKYMHLDVCPSLRATHLIAIYSDI